MAPLVISCLKTECGSFAGMKADTQQLTNASKALSKTGAAGQFPMRSFFVSIINV